MGRPETVGPYEAFFSASVRFESTMDALIFPLHWLDQRIAPEVATEGDDPLPPAAWDFSDHVRHQIARRIGIEPVTATAVASAMGLSRRSFDRQLSTTGVSFARIVDEVRYARARRLLTAGHARLSDISLALGYTEPSAFSRAFRGWAGCSPQEWRRSHGPNIIPHN